MNTFRVLFYVGNKGFVREVLAETMQAAWKAIKITFPGARIQETEWVDATY